MKLITLTSLLLLVSYGSGLSIREADSSLDVDRLIELIEELQHKLDAKHEGQAVSDLDRRGKSSESDENDHWEPYQVTANSTVNGTNTTDSMYMTEPTTASTTTATTESTTTKSTTTSTTEPTTTTKSTTTSTTESTTASTTESTTTATTESTTPSTTESTTTSTTEPTTTTESTTTSTTESTTTGTTDSTTATTTSSSNTSSTTNTTTDGSCNQGNLMFSAVRWVDIKSPQLIYFDQIYANVGNAFANPVFTAPCEGVYNFRASFQVQSVSNTSTKEMLLELVARNQVVMEKSLMNTCGCDGADSAVVDLDLHLLKGNQVWVRVSGQPDIVTKYHQFSGKLLLQL